MIAVNFPFIKSIHFEELNIPYPKKKTTSYSTDIEILEAINDSVTFFNANNCGKYYVFATEAVRSSKNSELIKTVINDEFGIKLDIISGDTEAVCDFYSVMCHDANDTGAGVDIGGGSAQIFTFNDKKITNHASLRLGALRLKNLFVSKLFPNVYELNEMNGYITDKIAERFKKESIPSFYLLGGTSHVIDKINRKYLGNSKLTNDTVYGLFETLNEMPEKKKLKVFEKYAPKREFLVIPCLCVLMCMSEYFEVKEFIPMDTASREGYVYLKLKENG